MDGGHEDWRSHELQLQDWQWRRSQRERCREGNHQRRRLREGVVCNLAWGSAEPGDQGGVTWRPMWLVNLRGARRPDVYSPARRTSGGGHELYNSVHSCNELAATCVRSCP